VARRLATANVERAGVISKKPARIHLGTKDRLQYRKRGAVSEAGLMKREPQAPCST
jgi:hypothetical protein